MLCVSACFTQVLPYQTYCLIDPDSKVGCLYMQHTLLVHQCTNGSVTVVLCAGYSCCVGRKGTSGVTFTRCSCTVMQLLHDVIDHTTESSTYPTCCDEEMCTAVCSTILLCWSGRLFTRSVGIEECKLAQNGTVDSTNILAVSTSF